MQLLYLDSFYFYAPITRVTKLRDRLEGLGLRNYRLLYGGFSGPRQFATHLLRTLYGPSARTAFPYARRGELEPSKSLQQLLELVKRVRSGRVRSKVIDLETLARIVGDERAAIIEFVLFVLQHPDNAEELIRRARIPVSTIRVDRSTAKALQLVVTRPEKMAELVVKRQVGLYKLYTEYTLCKTCLILGLRYPQHVVRMSVKPPSDLVRRVEEMCRECEDACRGHVDDIERAATLYSYAISQPSHRIYVATVATITRPRRGGEECFSCLATCLSDNVRNLWSIL